jgi:hypothetical protein
MGTNIKIKKNKPRLWVRFMAYIITTSGTFRRKIGLHLSYTHHPKRAKEKRKIVRMPG